MSKPFPSKYNVFIFSSKVTTDIKIVGVFPTSPVYPTSVFYTAKAYFLIISIPFIKLYMIISQMVSVGWGAISSTIMRMMCRGVRNCPFTPDWAILESRYS